MKLDTSKLKTFTVKKGNIEYSPNELYVKKNGVNNKVWGKYVLTISITNSSYGTYTVKDDENTTLSNGAAIYLNHNITGVATAAGVSYGNWNFTSLTKPTCTDQGGARTSAAVVITNSTGRTVDVYRGTTLIKSGLANNGTYTDSGLAFSTQYTYYLKATASRDKYTHSVTSSDSSKTVTGNTTMSAVFARATSTDTTVVTSAGTTVTTAAQSTFIVKWLNWDSTVLKTETVAYGGNATAPANPTRAQDNTYTYSFSSWDNDGKNITAAKTITAIFTPTYRNYSVSFTGTNSSATGTGTTFHYGDSYTVVATTSDGYYFSSISSGGSAGDAIEIYSSGTTHATKYRKYTFTGTIGGNVSLSGTGTQFFQVTANNPTYGKASPTTAYVTTGGNITISYTATTSTTSTRYSFSSSSSTTTTTTKASGAVTAAKTITAPASYVWYNLSSTQTNATFTGTGWKLNGSSYSVVATASSGYYLGSVTTGGSNTSTMSVNGNTVATKVTWSGTVSTAKSFSATGTKYYTYTIGSGLLYGSVYFSTTSKRVYLNGSTTNGYIDKSNTTVFYYTGTITPDVLFCSRETNASTAGVSSYYIRVEDENESFDAYAYQHDGDDEVIVGWSGFSPSRSDYTTYYNSYISSEHSTAYHYVKCNIAVTNTDKTISVEYDDSSAAYVNLTGVSGYPTLDRADGGWIESNQLYIADYDNYGGGDQMSISSSKYNLSQNYIEFGDSDDSPCINNITLSEKVTNPTITFAVPTANTGAYVVYTNTSGTVTTQRIGYSDAKTITVKSNTNVKIITYSDTVTASYSTFARLREGTTSSGTALKNFGWTSSQASYVIGMAKNNQESFVAYSYGTTAETYSFIATANKNFYVEQVQQSSTANPYGTCQYYAGQNSYTDITTLSSTSPSAAFSSNQYCTAFPYSWNTFKTTGTKSFTTIGNTSYPSKEVETLLYEDDEGAQILFRTTRNGTGFIKGLSLICYPDEDDWYPTLILTQLDIGFK